MIVFKFLRQQDWKYAIPCILLLALFLDFYTPGWLDNYIYSHNYSAWKLGFATVFLVCYSLKFAGKYNNLFIDRFKLVFYFVFFTIALLFPNTNLGIIAFYFCPWILFFLYLYSILIFYKNEMEEQGKQLKNFHLRVVTIFLTIIILMSIIWAITFIFCGELHAKTEEPQKTIFWNANGFTNEPWK